MNQPIVYEVRQEILTKVESIEAFMDIVKQYSVRAKAINEWFRPSAKDNISRTDDLPIVDEDQSPYHLLTQREWEIARMIMQGYSTKQISITLHITVGTVRNHLKSIYRKLDIHSRVQLTNKLAQYIDLAQSDLVYK